MELDSYLEKISFNDHQAFDDLYNLINTECKYDPYNDVEKVYNSKTYKTGKAVLWLPKKILQVLHIKK